MKSLRNTVLILIILITASPAFAFEKEIIGKIGTAYAFDPSRFGLDINFQYNWVLDPYFVLGPETGFYWITWNNKIGTEETTPNNTSAVKADSDAYMIPVILDAQLRLPNLKKYIYVTPYAIVGMGYSFMFLHYSQPNFTDSQSGKVYNKDKITKFYSGFTWQLIIGTALKPGSESGIEFLAEFGYRYAKLKSGDIQLDMSGILIRVGVRYPLGG